MNIASRHKPYLLFVLSILLIVLVIDMVSFAYFKNSMGHLREFLIMLLIVLAFLGFGATFSQLSIFNKVKIIFFSMICLLGINLILSRSEPDAPNVLFSVLIFFKIIIAVSVLRLIQELIFIQRKKSTGRNFYLMFIVIILYSIFSGDKSGGFSFAIGSATVINRIMPSEIISILLTVLMIYFMVVNSFRVQWVKFLNKSQKIKTFFLNSFGIASIVSFTAKKHSAVFYGEFTPNFLNAIFIFAAIYLSVSILVILLQLPTAGFLDRRAREMSSLHQLSQMIIGVFHLDKVMNIIIKQTVEITGANYSWLLIKNPKTSTFELMAQHDLPENLRMRLTENTTVEFVDWIVANKTVLMIDRVSRDHRTAKMLEWKNREGSLLGIPLISDEEIFGILLAVKNEDYGFLADDKALLSMFANNATAAIENARLIENSLEKEKYQQELKIAHEAQRKLLPASMPELEKVDIDATSITANEVGGDYYDFFEFSKTKLGIVIGDVSGKGAEAAFYMAEAKGIIESLSSIYKSPRDVLISANKILCNTLDKRTFISLLYGILDLKHNNFTFCRAGHCPLLYWNGREEQVFLIETPGLALGLVSGNQFDQTLVEEKVRFRAGDIFILYTDGVNEARNSKQQEFEEERLCDLVVENRGKNATAIKNAILEKIENFVGDQSQYDDLTMVVLKPK
ncbi:MAG TPA: GAF domain-containing protein [bacterium]|mgnify:CR=1 FL=1|nr:GAF domain-containing protein [bacterium]